MGRGPDGGPALTARLVLRRLTVRRSGAAATALRDVDLRLGAGEAVALSGRSGTGKTTLLHAVAGLIPWARPGRVEGEVEIDGGTVDDLDPGQRAHLLATCLDRPDAQLFLATPRAELEAARRLFGDGPLSGCAPELLGLGPLLDRRVTELSSGERQRVALALALLGTPRPVLLDEPTANLDAAGTAALVELLRRMAAEGGAALVAEQAGWRLAPGVDRWLRLAEGAAAAAPPAAPPALPGVGHAPGSEVVLAARGLTIARAGRTLLERVELTLRRGELVLLTGANGAGKSTLAEVLTGVRRAAAGDVRRHRRTVLALPSAELQLLAPKVSAELAAAAAPAERARVLRRHRLEHLAARAPWSLSRGERQRLLHAALDTLRPEVMVLDEPAQGLDPEDLAELVDRIHRRAARGRAYLLVSHRAELAGAVHRHLEIAGERIVEVLEGGRA